MFFHCVNKLWYLRCAKTKAKFNNNNNNKSKYQVSSVQKRIAFCGHVTRISLQSLTQRDLQETGIIRELQEEIRNVTPQFLSVDESPSLEHGRRRLKRIENKYENTGHKVKPKREKTVK